MAADFYTVVLTIDAEEQHDAVEALWQAFTNDGPFLATPTGIRHADGCVTIEFAEVPDDPTTVPTSVEHGTPGAEVVAALEGFSHAHSLMVPVVRALLTATAMRQAAGLPRPRELRIGVLPAAPLPQDSVSQRLSESVHLPSSGFGGGRT
jgi:hypothetical protein